MTRKIGAVLTNKSNLSSALQKTFSGHTMDELVFHLMSSPQNIIIVSPGFLAGRNRGKYFVTSPLQSGEKEFESASDAVTKIFADSKD